jgi:rhamnulokinase
VPRPALYDATGIQFMPFNTLFQIYAMVRERSPLLDAAADLLFMPDLFAYLLTGRKAAELTIASTSQLLDPRTKTWIPGLFQAMGLSKKLLQDLVEPGTVLGPLTDDVAADTGFRHVPVVATASHDTASAVAAVPAEGHKGCRKAWSAEGEVTYDDLTRAATDAPAFAVLIDPDSPRFLNPPDMPEAIAGYCRATNQVPPMTRAAMIRSLLESLALKYRHVIEQLALVLGHPIEKIHVIGGGSRNTLLCQLTADATRIPVVAGPAEATAIGNILVQAMAMGRVASPAEMRAIIRASFELRTYAPSGSQAAWDAAYVRFRGLLEA